MIADTVTRIPARAKAMWAEFQASYPSGGTLLDRTLGWRPVVVERLLAVGLDDLLRDALALACVVYVDPWLAGRRHWVDCSYADDGSR